MATVQIPEGETTVKVSIIDTGARMKGPISMFVEPPLLDHLQAGDLKAPAYVFLIEHEKTGRKVVFDLGIRKEIEQYAPSVLEYHKAFTITPGLDVSELLRDNGIALDSIEAVVWSHHHIDHVGNPAGFPSSTDLVVGPGFKETELPGYPENPKAKILQADYEGRTLRQIDFDTESKGLRIGGFKAVDWFDDGSFYLLQTPGHTIDHIAALARTNTSPSRFILMGGDLAHHPSQWRPNEFAPLPTELTPSPFGPNFPLNIRRNVCPSELFTNTVHPSHSDATPFTWIRAGHPYDVETARESLKTIESFDADENILVVMAHDWTLLGILDYFPKSANGWYDAAWKERGRWEFLKDLVWLVERSV